MSSVKKAAKTAKSIAKSVKRAIKKGAATAVRPLKKARTSLSSRASSVDIFKGNDKHPSSSQEDNAEDEPKGETDEQELEHLQGGWCSPMYAFFQAEVSVGYDEGHKYHFFKCASGKCKGKGQKGVCRYLDSKDRAATSNLKSHAVRCFGQDLVESAFEKTQPRGCNGSIFAAFARQGQQPIKISHRAHTTEESR